MTDGPGVPTPQDAIATMRATPAALDAALQGLPGELVRRRPVPDEWSAHEILAHMIAAERTILGRVEAMIATDAAPTSRPTHDEPTDDTSALVRRWHALRATSLERLAGLERADLEHGADLPRYGRVTVAEQLREWAYHDLEHVRQIMADAEAFLYPGIAGYVVLHRRPYDEG